MFAASLSQASLSPAHRAFHAALPRIDDTIRFHFRLWPHRHREEAVAEARAATWAAWHGLLSRGKDPVAIGVGGIAFNACRFVKNGRRIGNRSVGSDAMDVQHPRARRTPGLRIVSIEDVSGPASGSCVQWLAADNRVSPADQAAFRIDLVAWLAGLTERKRRVAELLAEGHETGAVARVLGVSPARVSQVRTELEASWKAFQDEAVADSEPCPPADPHRVSI